MLDDNDLSILNVLDLKIQQYKKIKIEIFRGKNVCNLFSNGSANNK